MRQLLTVVGLALVAGFPSLAAAQSTETPAPPIVPAAPPALDTRPMRFLLSTGAVVIGTRIGERPDAIGVRTATGIVTIYKAQVVTMDYRVELGRNFDLRGGAAPVALARPAPPVPVQFETPRERPRPRHPGRGARIAGGIVFGLSYGVSLIGAVAAASDRDSQLGALFAVPVVGPLLFGLVSPNDAALSIGILFTAVQTIGAALLIHGLTVTADPDEEPRRVSLGVAPVLTADVQGLVLSGVM